MSGGANTYRRDVERRQVEGTGQEGGPLIPRALRLAESTRVIGTAKLRHATFDDAREAPPIRPPTRGGK